MDLATSGTNRSRGPESALVNPWRMTKLPRFGLESTEERVLKRARTRAALPTVMPGGKQSSSAHPYLFWRWATVIWTTTYDSASGRAHCWKAPKNTSSPSIRVSLCGRITNSYRLQNEDEAIDRCMVCIKRYGELLPKGATK